MSRLRDVTDVAERHLCTGCGVCAYLAPGEIAMVDAAGGVRRPLPLTVVGARTPARHDAVMACPGRALEQHDYPAGHVAELGDAWGPVLEIWEGYATDPEIRSSGSSGGVATALALHCLDAEGMHGVLHTAAREDVPYLNRTVLSRSRTDLLAATGSRYAPASPCDGLARVESAPEPCAFIGKPCDVAGAVAAARLRPRLAERLGLTIAFFCAGTPTTAGTLEAVRSLGIEPDDVASVRYRGQGWPGRFTVRSRSGKVRSLSYEESWGDILQRHRQWRCMVCPDHTGEFADISVGDPWYRTPGEGDQGESLVLVRTERGRAVLAGAMAGGAVRLRAVGADLLPRSQPNLLRTRGAVWGRVVTMRGMGLAVPRFRGLPMVRLWLRLTAREKVTSTVGTARRVVRRGLWRREPVRPFDGAVTGGRAAGR
jgi:coenzyme F420 hydrogenase subunit beta